MFFRERSLLPSYVTMLTTARSQRYHMLVQRSNSWKRLSNSSVCACVLLCGQLFGEAVLPTVQYMSNCFLACMLACALSSIGWLDTPQATSRDILRNILHSYDYCYSFFAERGCTSECFVCSVPFLTNNYILSWKCLESYRLRECYCLIRSYMWRQMTNAQLLKYYYYYYSKLHAALNTSNLDSRQGRSLGGISVRK